MTYFYPDETYTSMVSSAGELISEWCIGDWQGDYVYLIKNKDKYGFVVVGYGSCTGCDALQSCNNKKDVKALKESIISNIVWGTKEEISNYVFSKDANRWYFYEKEWKSVQKDLKELLK